MEDKLFDYAIQYIRTQKVFRKDAYFEEWNETLRVNNIILLDKATVVDMAMCHVESEMYRIIKEYFNGDEEHLILHGDCEFPFDVYDYSVYHVKSASVNEYVQSLVGELDEMASYIAKKYSSLLGSYYFS
jgi:hypothetical protein